jgi:C-terminal processing protease CtpA/Prc
VIFVAPGGPAEKQGLKPNDVIVAINGRPTKQIPASEVQAWRWGALGDEIALTLSDGSTHRFHLRDYF